jgi:hypothetical protein
MPFTQEMPLQKKDDRIEYIIFIIKYQISTSNFFPLKNYEGYGEWIKIPPKPSYGSYSTANAEEYNHAKALPKNRYKYG